MTEVQTVNSQYDAHQLAKNGVTARYWMDEAWFTVTPDMVKDAPVALPAPFDETAPQQATGGWVRDPEIEAMDLSAAKQFIRDLGLHAPSDLEYVAQKQADEVNRAMIEMLKAQTKNDKLLESQKIELELKNLRTREEAKKRYKLEQETADLSLFENSINLYEAFQLPEEAPQWRIKDLLMVGHITTVTAPAKAGKTVLQVNRVKSFVDGNALFGRYQTVTPVTGNVGVWNFELNQAQMHEWFRKKGIINTHKIIVVNARGANLFIQNENVLEAAIKWANDNDIEILEIDPLQAAFFGSVNSDEDAASYINALQRLQKETGIKDIILTTHMGHGAKTNVDAERTIGSARWEGFPDNMWIYKRDHNNGMSYLRIDKGRMESVPEFGLSCDTTTWTLNYEGDTANKKKNDLFKSVVTRMLDGTVHFKTPFVEAVAGTDATKKKEVRAIIGEMVKWGIVEASQVVKEDSKTNQKSDTVRLNEVGCRLFQKMIDSKGYIQPPTDEEIDLASEDG
jgi:RecA-family ATPase